MSVPFLAASAAAAVSAVATGILVARFARLLRLDQAAWAYAAAGFTIALAAQALGFYKGFNAAAFRAVQIGAGLVAPMALVWGLAELTGKRFWARFAARLMLAALTVIAGVILAADPLSGVTFTTAWPAAAMHYQLIAHTVLLAVIAATVLTALIALILTAVRARHEPGWREALPAVTAAALAAMLTGGLQVKLPISAGYTGICLIAVVLTWFAGQRSGRLHLGALHDPEAPTDDTWGGRYADDKGYGGLYEVGTGDYEPVSTDTDYAGLRWADTGYYEPAGRDTDYRGLRWTDTGGLEEVGSDTDYGFYRTDTDLRPVLNGSADSGHVREPMPGIVETGDVLPMPFDVFTPVARASDGPGTEETARLYGRIAIYTLIEGQAEGFDRLAHDVVERVKALEPDTLAYIVHGVPSAPLQRILYEVYRDEAAFEEHVHQPYIQDFEEERKPYVLATNVIELGVRQAKLSPLGGPSYPPAPAGPPGQRPPASPSQRPPSQRPPSQRPADQRSQGSQPGPAAPRGRTGPHAPPGEPGPQHRPGPVAPGNRPGPGGPVAPGSRMGPPGSVARGSRTGPPGAGRPDPYGRPDPHGPPGGSAVFPAPPDGESARSWSNGIQ
jgi:quinol monooxygenase YgiN